jgi:ligand-binding sensor domain-containing protein
MENIYRLMAIIAAISLTSADTAAVDRWISHTSTSQVRYIDYFNDSLQVMTSGGWLKINPVTLGMTKTTNVDGLGTNNLYYILKDGGSVVWLAGYGKLIKYSEGEYSPYLFLDQNEVLLTLYTIEDDDSTLWVGTSSGLALFSKEADGGQIEDFYYRFGDFNPNPAVNDIAIRGDTIWIATSSGLAVANKSNPRLLKSHLNWRTFNTGNFPELLSDNVTALAHFHDDLYVGTTKGAFRFVVDGPDTSFVRVPTRSGVSVKHMIVQGDSLVIYAVGGFFIHTAGGTIWNNTPTLDYVFAAGRFIDSIHWVGFQNKGLYYGLDNNYVKYNDSGLPGNIVTALSSNGGGRIAGCFNRNPAAAYDGRTWDTILTQVGEWATSIVQDDSDRIWIGTWGSGAAMISRDTVIQFNEDNSSLGGVADAPGYVVAFNLASDGKNLFITNFASRLGNAVSVADMNDISRWESFGADDGIPIMTLTSIDCRGGSFVAGTADKGVYLYYYGDDPFDKSDDSAVNLREDNSWLGSNTVNVVKFDNEGTLWVGTKFGLSRYDPGIERFVNVVLPQDFGPEITALEFDRRGNIWMGARNGLARYDASTYSIDVFTILNSDLSDNQINALAINRKTGDLWIGTPSGISQLLSDIGPPTQNIAEVIAFPNPFIIRGGDDLLYLNYDGVAAVRYYTVAGELVREMSANNPWDGKNQRGIDVASGVYLFLITAADGSVGRGKILLVRE